MDAENGIPAALWQKVSSAEHRLLMLDYDGTLAPFNVEPDEALPWPLSLELLRALTASSHTRVGIVSGRPIEDLDQLLGPLDAAFVGEHGWEHRDRGGAVVREPVTEPVSAQLDAAEAAARRLGWGEQLERKRAALVLHTRELPPAEAHDAVARCAQAWLEPASHPGVQMDRIDGGLELRASAYDKGTATSWLLSTCPPETLGVFVGDDLTDEDAFEAVLEHGFGVRVGDHSRGSLAQARLPSYRAVPAFLGEWLELADRAQARGRSS